MQPLRESTVRLEIQRQPIHLYAVRGTGTAETSGYPALASFLNEIDGALKPKIATVIHPANSGAGLPDGEFFSAKPACHQQPAGTVSFCRQSSHLRGRADRGAHEIEQELLMLEMKVVPLGEGGRIWRVP